MTQTEAAVAIPIHRRTMEFEAFTRATRSSSRAGCRTAGRGRPGPGAVEHLHDMSLRLTVRTSDLVIERADADMRRFPHAECPAIEASFGALAGLSVSRGYVRAVQERFGRANGCAHLEQLARAMGPVVVQAITSCRLPGRFAEPVSGDAGPTLWQADTCHVWKTGGVGEQKLAVGWRPGQGGYPAPPLADVREAIAERRTPSPARRGDDYSLVESAEPLEDCRL